MQNPLSWVIIPETLPKTANIYFKTFCLYLTLCSFHNKKVTYEVYNFFQILDILQNESFYNASKLMYNLCNFSRPSNVEIDVEYQIIFVVVIH